MTIIDTSAWIEFFRPKGDLRFKGLVRDLLSVNQAAYTCPVAFELLAGARKSELADLRSALALSSRVVLRPEHWDKAAASSAALRAQGVNVPVSDLLIAIVAQSEKLPLLAKDAHFESIRERSLVELNIVAPAHP